MDTRRDFLKKAALMSGISFGAELFPSIEKALAIEAGPGTSYLDAEHVIILMQENRSFDHCFGTLNGVRGYNDPRAATLPNGNPVWLQQDEAGRGFAPFRLNLKDTKATWMGSLPHSWTDQVDARNDGKHDRWIKVKASGNENYAKMPLTLGHYNRQDLPFYHSLADAFTICDQYFCSSLTGTTPNRLFLWTGTIREKQAPSSPANVFNSDVDYGKEASWGTFPERLEQNNVSWKVYQNELSMPSGLKGEEEDWLSNFTDNPLEWFTQFNVRFAQGHQKFLEEQTRALEGEIEALTLQREHATSEEEVRQLTEQINDKRSYLEEGNAYRRRWGAENFDRLSSYEKNLHQRAFTTNSGDPDYHSLASLTYQDGGEQRTMQVPKGDVLHQLRQDVDQGKLPTVSWIVAPEKYSDHPGSAWYGAWYVAEVLNILTRRPEVWKKTILILNYDENDGYFDHALPFVPPHPERAGTGMVSPGIDVGVEYVLRRQEEGRRGASEVREGPIGLGHRVPMLIASPWTRGGRVCSQVFDHTSTLQFLEKFLKHKTGKEIKEDNISLWRRTVCGDLTSAFQSSSKEKSPSVHIPNREQFLAGIHQAQYREPPHGFREFSGQEMEELRQNPQAFSYLPKQEKGTRPSAPLPYELLVNGKKSDNGETFNIRLEASSSVGSAFIVHECRGKDNLHIRNYAVSAASFLEDALALEEFQDQKYRIKVYGPNGFFREFQGSPLDPALEVRLDYQRLSGGRPGGNVELHLRNRHKFLRYKVDLRDMGQMKLVRHEYLAPGESRALIIETGENHRWYDYRIMVDGSSTFSQRFAGRVENGSWGYTDPQLDG